MYKRLVLSGGALKGFGYIGVLRCLEEKGITKTLESFVGTSIGSFFALLVVLNYTSDDLLKIFTGFDPQSIIEYKLSNFIETYGLDDGKKLEDFIKIFIKNKGFKEHITMKELHEKTKKTIVFTSCHVNKKQRIFIDHLTFPDLPVYLGTRMSMNVPVVFSPVLYKENYYIDGCFTCNLPVFYYDAPSSEEDKILIIFLKDDINTHVDIKSLYSYLSLVPKCSFSTMEKESMKYCLETLNEKILHLDIKTIDLKFTMDNATKKHIIDKSYEKCKDFLS